MVEVCRLLGFISVCDVFKFADIFAHCVPKFEVSGLLLTGNFVQATERGMGPRLGLWNADLGPGRRNIFLAGRLETLLSNGFLLHKI